MNSFKIIVNTSTGKPRDVVLVVEENDEIVVIDAEPPTEAETLVNVGRFNDFVKPKWDEQTGDFIESATAEEIAAARPTPLEAEPSAENYLLDFEYRLSKLELGV